MTGVNMDKAMKIEGIKKIKADGERQVQVFKEELLLQKKEYLKSQVQTAISVIKFGLQDEKSKEPC